MSLADAKPVLEAAIAAAFQSRKDNGEDNAQLAKDLTNAFHDYVIAADVNPQTITTIDPGGALIAGVATVVAMTAMGPAPGTGPATGAVASPTTCTHAGLGKLQ